MFKSIISGLLCTLSLISILGCASGAFDGAVTTPRSVVDLPEIMIVGSL